MVLLSRLASYYEADVEDLKTRNKVAGKVKARSVFCYLTMRMLKLYGCSPCIGGNSYGLLHYGLVLMIRMAGPIWSRISR